MWEIVLPRFDGVIAHAEVALGTRSLTRESDALSELAVKGKPDVLPQIMLAGVGSTCYGVSHMEDDSARTLPKPHDGRHHQVAH